MRSTRRHVSVLAWALFGFATLIAHAHAAQTPQIPKGDEDASDDGLEALAPPGVLVPVPFTRVEIEDTFWSPRLETVSRQTIPHVLEMCEKTGRIANFDRAAGTADGAHQGYFFDDSDVYKALEGAIYQNALRPDPERAAAIEALITRIAAAQQPDGYLNSYYTLTKEQRWSNLRVKHELYCAGHLIEVGVADYLLNRRRTLLDVATRFADRIATLFGPDARHDVPGHEGIELALYKLARVTGNQRYADLATFFLEQRGRHASRASYGEYCQDHQPIREQREIVGHAVRAMYLYAGATELAETIDDKDLIAALQAIWRDVVQRKMYVTGGIGPSAHNEGFTVAYDLPNGKAYSETCASIGMVLWNHRLNLLHADARYVDVLERVLYNGLLASIALDGKHFNYTNPLASDGVHARREWYRCACCPPNLARFFPTLGQYIYATGRDKPAIYVNLYIGSHATVDIADRTVRLVQQSRYPWDNEINLLLEPDAPSAFSLYLRQPEWCREMRIRVNGEDVAARTRNGYRIIARTWQRGDTVAISLKMPVERILANPRVRANAGAVALQRGPLVYCIEDADHVGGVADLVLPRNTALVGKFVPDLLGGTYVIDAPAIRTEPVSWRNKLYQPAALPRRAPLRAIPYCLWGNRTAGAMRVWIPETQREAAPVAAGVTVSASHCFKTDSLDAVVDGVTPDSSHDSRIPRFTWWPRRGSQEWIACTFDAPRRIHGARVYWFDDTPNGGGCKPPVRWKLQRRTAADDDATWQDLPVTGAYETHLNRFNVIYFTPTEAHAIRILADLAEGHSAGILEWELLEE